VIVPDVIRVLLREHNQMRRLCADVRQARGTDKKGLFAELYQNHAIRWAAAPACHGQYRVSR